MEWITRLNQAIAYMEEHLDDEISYEELGKICCCSCYHFQRMFAYMADMPLSEYIRRRKMSLAAVDVQSTDAKIIDIALKYGYNSPTAFTRAFQLVHGVAPSQLRKEGITVKSYPPLLFKITVKGVQEMNYRIEKKDGFRVVGISCPMEKEAEQNFAKIPMFWHEAGNDGTLDKLVGMMDTELKGVLGVCAAIGDDWKYYIAVASPQADESMEEYEVPSFTWAVFSGEGVCPKTIQDLEQQIMAEWLPTSGYEFANGPDVELYLSPDMKDAKFEVWVPVVKK